MSEADDLTVALEILARREPFLSAALTDLVRASDDDSSYAFEGLIDSYGVDATEEDQKRCIAAITLLKRLASKTQADRLAALEDKLKQLTPSLASAYVAFDVWKTLDAGLVLELAREALEKNYDAIVARAVEGSLLGAKDAVDKALKRGDQDLKATLCALSEELQRKGV